MPKRETKQPEPEAFLGTVCVTQNPEGKKEGKAEKSDGHGGSSRMAAPCVGTAQSLSTVLFVCRPMGKQADRIGGENLAASNKPG